MKNILDNIELTEGFTLKGKQFKEIAQDKNVIVGFECEFIARPFFDEKNHIKIEDIDNIYDFRQLADFKLADFTDMYEDWAINEFLKLKKEQPNIWTNLVKQNLRKIKKLPSSFAINKKYLNDFEAANPDEFNRIVEYSAKGHFTQVMFFNSQGSMSLFLKLNAKPMFGYYSPGVVYTHEPSAENQEIKALLKRQLGLEFGLDKQSWKLVNDFSIVPDNIRKGERGHELISPPMPVLETLVWVKKIFSWIEKNDFYTNSTCGFHINISYKDQAITQKIDILKVAVLTGENYLLNIFDRLENEYTPGQLDHLRQNLVSLYDPELKEDFPSITTKVIKALENKQVKLMINDLRKLLNTNQHQMSIDFEKLNRGYLEFRMAGNADYEKNPDLIVKTILRLAYVIKASLDPEAFKKEYIKKLYQLVMNTLFADFDKIANDGIGHGLIEVFKQNITLAQAYTRMKQEFEKENTYKAMSDLIYIITWIEQHRLLDNHWIRLALIRIIKKYKVSWDIFKSYKNITTKNAIKFWSEYLY